MGQNSKNFSRQSIRYCQVFRHSKNSRRSKKKIKPSIIYTHYPEDLNIDHRIVAEATLTAFRPLEDSFEKIFAFEIPSSTDFRYYKKTFNPNFFNDIKILEN